MPVNDQYESTSLIDRSMGWAIGMYLICWYKLTFEVGTSAHKIPTDSRPLKSLAAGFGVCAGSTTDKEGSE